MNTAARRIALLLVALLIVAVPPIEGSSSGKHSQAGQGCTCHTNNNNGMSATHNFTTTYMPGIIYAVGINLNGGSQSFNGGFNVVVDKGTLMNPGAGVKINTPTSNSATHTSRGQLGWDFEWMAPQFGSGTVTVEIAVLQADANLQNTGDSWDRLTVTIPEFTPPPPPNDPPEASNVAVTPSPEARTDADLSVVYDYADNDSDPESGTTIKWYVDGTVNTAHSGKSTINSSSTQPGQKWKAEVTPNDGTDAGAPVMSNEITIIDIDSDNDGVLDGQDQFPTDPNEWDDTDGDGVGDNGDLFPNDGSESADTDNDGVGDNADRFDDDPTETTDTDNDGVGDNADAFPNNPAETADSDMDGVGDNGDAFPNDASETVDSDEDGVGDNGDAFPSDPFESADSDMDGVGDNADAFDDDATQTTDRDGDGYGDNAEGNNPDAFPQDATEWMDSDGDGVGDNGDAFPNDASQSEDQDGDGYGDNPQGTTPDMFKTDATQWADADNDGYGDNPDGTNADLFPADSTEWFDSDLDGVGDNADAFPNDPDETMDSDGDGMGDNEQAVLEAKLAAEQEEADASARMRMIIGAVLVLLVGAGAGVFYLRSRSGADGGEEVAKDFGMPDLSAQPTTAIPDMYAQPAQPAAASYDPMYTQPVVTQPVDDSALDTLIEPESVAAAAIAMPETVVAPVAAEPAVVAPVEPSVVNQWTDENGHTWRVMSDGSNRWWNGTDWQKV